MSGMEAFDWVKAVVERWGFPTLVAVCFAYVMRQDIVLPLVSEHTRFLDELTNTQKEIGEAIKEQTRLLYMMQPRTASYKMHDDTPQN